MKERLPRDENHKKKLKLDLTEDKMVTSGNLKVKVIRHWRRKV